MLQPSPNAVKTSAEKGMIIPFLALLLAAMFILVALAVDAAVFMRTRNQLTTATDIGALVGATMLKEGASDAEAQRAATEAAQANIDVPLTGGETGEISLAVTQDTAGKIVTVNSTVLGPYFFGAAFSELAGKQQEISQQSTALLETISRVDRFGKAVVLLVDTSLGHVGPLLWHLQSFYVYQCSRWTWRIRLASILCKLQVFNGRPEGNCPRIDQAVWGKRYCQRGFDCGICTN